MRPQGADLIVTKLATAPWVPSAHPTVVRRLGAIDDWRRCSWIAWDRDMAGFGPARWLSKHVPDAKVVLRTSHFSTQIIAAEAKLGVVMVPEPYFRVRKLAPLDTVANLQPALDFEPLGDDGSIETAGIGENDAFDLGH